MEELIEVNTPTLIFDENNTNWYPDLQANVLFLKSVHNYLNLRLQKQGHLFLNEVYDSLGFKRTRQGALCGWIKGEGSDYIGFEVKYGDREPAISIDITVQGLIYDKIEDPPSEEYDPHGGQKHRYYEEN